MELREKVRVERFILGELETNCYLIWSPDEQLAMVVDPGGDVAEVLARIKEADLKLSLVVNTHGHGDHISGNRRLLEESGAELAIGSEDAAMLADPNANLSVWLGTSLTTPPPGRLLRHGDRLTLGSMEFEIRSTPGHTPGSITILGSEPALAFVGDTLFAGSIGRTDLPGGNEETLLASIRRELLSLPDFVRVYPGHGPETTIGNERLSNLFLSE